MHLMLLMKLGEQFLIYIFWNLTRDIRLQKDKKTQDIVISFFLSTVFFRPTDSTKISYETSHYLLHDKI